MNLIDAQYGFDGPLIDISGNNRYSHHFNEQATYHILSAELSFFGREENCI